MSEIGIGTELWTHPYGRPERWEGPHKITDETPQSWIVNGHYKVRKRNLQEAIRDMLPRRWYTAQGRIDLIFLRAHRANIAGAIYSINDVEKLKQIAAIIGMEVGNAGQ